jgi:hypothetical protein
MNSQLRVNLESLVEKHGLTKFKDELLSQAKPAAILISERASVAALSLCHSKLGGKPDVPPNFIWPT